MRSSRSACNGAGRGGERRRRSTFVGQGFQDPCGCRAPAPINVNPVNPNLNLGGLLPVNPSTAMPLGGNLVNLPTSLLPTLAGATPAGGLLLGIIGSNFNINLAIQALEVQGKARTLAEPKTVTVENAKATISRGFEVPFVSTPSQGLSQVQFKEALLKLEVTPRVIRDNADLRIRMKVVFENNEPDFSGQRSVNGNPSIFKRRQETEVLISQGQRLVVGGVTNDTSALTTRRGAGVRAHPRARLALQEPRDEQDGRGADRHPDADRARRGRGGAEVSVYEAFWRLERAPFVVTPDVRFLLRARSHHESLAALLDGVARETGVMVLVGDVGTGKTLLCRALCAELSPERTGASSSSTRISPARSWSAPSSTTWAPRAQGRPTAS